MSQPTWIELPQWTEALAALNNKLPQLKYSLDKKDLSFYATDWTKFFQPQARLVVFPQSRDEVVEIVTWAREHRIPLVPSGGRTGLSGGAVAHRGEVVLSLEKMNKILEFNPVERTLRVQGGVTTAAVQEFARSQGLFYPVDFAAKESSHVAGNIATNAGGIRVLRYGSTRSWVRSLKVVTGKGELMHLGRGLIKDSSGPRLMDTFIGSEGIFGIIVEAELELTSPPPAWITTLLGISELKNVTQVFQHIRKVFTLSAFEFFSDLALAYVKKMHHYSSPFQAHYPWYVVLDVEKNLESDEESFLQELERLMEQGLVQDVTLAQSSEQAKQLWAYRERISESLAPYKPYKNDISVRISQVPDFLKDLDTIIKQHYQGFDVVWFGHIGDGNLHSNIVKPDLLSPEEFYQKAQAIDGQIMQLVHRYGGSVSAEHGIGLIKKPFLHLSKSREEIEALRTLKSFFDPDGVMNPGKVLD
jgi:FAD/FMN-containing dehydrogenase